MQITPAQLPAPAVEAPDGAALQVKGPSVPARTVPAPAEIAPQSAKPAPVQLLQRQTDVTLHQDANGRPYYLVSDARSGQEIIEVPPKEVRDVGHGIQEYLQEEESKAASRFDTKA